MDSQMQIGLEVNRTERSHHGGYLALDQQQFPGTAGKNDYGTQFNESIIHGSKPSYM